MEILSVLATFLGAVVLFQWMVLVSLRRRGRSLAEQNTFARGAAQIFEKERDEARFFIEACLDEEKVLAALTQRALALRELTRTVVRLQQRLAQPGMRRDLPYLVKERDEHREKLETELREAEDAFRAGRDEFHRLLDGAVNFLPDADIWRSSWTEYLPEAARA